MSELLDLSPSSVDEDLIRACVDRVVSRLADTGQITKEEVLGVFGFPERLYPSLQSFILQSHRKEILPGPQGLGGFLLANGLSRNGLLEITDDSHIDPSVMADWETKALHRLVSLLDYKDLERLLGPKLQYAVRMMRLYDTGANRRGNKIDLAHALMIAHGRDLLADKGVRLSIARSCGVESPGAWHPGKGSALDFVQETGFPHELAGLLSPDRAPDFEQLEGHVLLPPLLDFQIELKSKILNHILQSQGSRAIATLPTGAGKTRLMVEGVRELINQGSINTVVWLAHTEELCEQAFQCFREVWESNLNASSVICMRYWGRYSDGMDAHSRGIQSLLNEKTVVITSPLRLLNSLNSNGSTAHSFANALISDVAVIVIDEAHRAGAPTYLAIIDRVSGIRPRASFIGLTATPWRTDNTASPGISTQVLKSVFGILLTPDSLGDRPRANLQEKGVLAKLDFVQLILPYALNYPQMIPDNVDQMDPELAAQADRLLQDGADAPRRRLQILEELVRVSKEPKTSILYFGPTVNDAQAMAFMLRNQHIPSAFVGSDTRPATRRQIIGDFKLGRIRVLCNCEVLTTGFDAPKVSHLFIARPTVSRVLWEQMIGRGLRGPMFGGTPECTVYDCVDNFTGDKGKIDGFLGYKRSWFRDVSGRDNQIRQVFAATPVVPNPSAHQSPNTSERAESTSGDVDSSPIGRDEWLSVILEVLQDGHKQEREAVMRNAANLLKTRGKVFFKRFKKNGEHRLAAKSAVHSGIRRRQIAGDAKRIWLNKGDL